MSTTKLREKYRRRENGWTPAGARDVRKLCDAVDEYIALVEWCVDNSGSSSTKEYVRDELWEIRRDLDKGERIGA